MTETVSQFRQRVAQLRDECPKWRHGQTVFNAMGYPSLGSSVAQVKWAWKLDFASGAEPFFDDSQISAFLAAAVAAGVLREG